MKNRELRPVQPALVRVTLFLGLLLVAGVLLPSCGGNQGNSASSGETGSLSFTAEFNSPLPSDGERAPLAPDIDVCYDYGLSFIDLKVIKADNTVVAESLSIPCGNHEGTVRDVPAGSGYYLKVEGRGSSGPVIWRGISNSFAVASGKETPVGTVAVHYIGSDTTHPAVLSTNPVDNTTNVRYESTIRILFSEPMAGNTVEDNSAIVVTDNLSRTVAGQIVYADNAATFVPSSLLGAGLRFTVTVDNNVVTDMAGLHPAAAKVFRFTTHATGTFYPSMAVTAFPTGGDALSFRPISVDDSGNAMIVGSHSGDIVNSYVWESRASYLSNSWSTPGVISRTADNSIFPQVAGDGSGNRIVLWHGSYGNVLNNFPMYNRYTPAGGWGAAAWIPGASQTGYRANPVSLSMNRSGQGVAVWTDNVSSGYAVKQAEFTGVGASWGAWDYMTMSGAIQFPSSATDGAGRKAVSYWQLWTTYLRPYVRVKETAWSDTIPLDNSIFSAFPPAVSAGDNGVFFASWTLADRHVYVNRYVSGAGADGWGTATRVTATMDNSTSAAITGFPMVDSNASNRAIVSWVERRMSDNTFVIRASLFNGTSWSAAPDVISARSAAYSESTLPPPPRARIAANGDACVVYWIKTSSTTYGLYANIRQSGVWKGPVLLDTGTFSHTPAFAVGATTGARFLAAWTRGETAGARVYAAWGE